MNRIRDYMKRFMLFLILIISIFGINCVCAADMDDGLAISSVFTDDLAFENYCGPLMAWDNVEPDEDDNDTHVEEDPRIIHGGNDKDIDIKGPKHGPYIGD